MNSSSSSLFARLLILGTALLCTVLSSSCSSSNKSRPHTAEFYLENDYPTRENITFNAQELLQISNKRPVITDKEIADVDLVRVDAGVCLLFHLTPSSTMRFAHTTANNLGKRLVLVLDGKPVGTRLIDEIIQNGQLFTFTELSQEEMGRAVLQLKEVRKIAIPDGNSGEGKPIGR